MDLDELLDRPTQGKNRPTRFAPKGSKFKPRPKTEPSQSLPPSKSDDVESSSVPKKEDPGSQPDIKPDYADNAIDMDVEVKPVVKNEETADSVVTEAMEVEGEPEDEVVREIDVYFAPSIDPQTRLYLLQYPLRPLWRPYELDDKCEVRVKPGSAEVEIDLAIDVDSKNYDSGADTRMQIKKQTLAPSWKPPETRGCAVGVLTGNKLLLNPIHAVVQLRPSMHHLDSKESKRKSVVRTSLEDSVKSEEHQEAKPSGTSKKPSKILEQTKDGGEVWLPLKYHSMRSDLAAEYFRKMMPREGSKMNFSMSSYDYLNSLCPGASTDNFKSKRPPRRALLALPLKERLRIWFLQGTPIHKFDALKYLAPDYSVEDFLTVLQESARLVQGLWVPKSSLVYGTDQGIDLLAWDYVLVQFSKKTTFTESQLPQQTQLAKPVSGVLNVLARRRPIFEDWKLKEHPDMSFIKSNPSVVEKQQEELEFLARNINSLLPGGRNGPGVKASSKTSTTKNPATAKGPSKLATRTPSRSTPRTGMPEEKRVAIMKALQKLFKSVKVCSFQQISQRLRDMAVSESARSTGFAREAVAAAKSIDDFPDELQEIVSQVAVNIHGICVPISSPDHPEYDEFRRVVIDLFLADGPNAKLKKASIREAVNMKLGKEITDTAFRKVLEELCVSQNSAWILRTADGNPKH